MVLDIEFDGFVLDLVCYICYEDFFFVVGCLKEFLFI